LTSDGVFAYAYDAANQLTNVVRTADGARVLSARYDALGRRVEATRADGSVERYVYFPGSFLVLAVLDGANAVKEIYTRGPDLSGSLDGAGGIGGILAVTDSSSVVRYSHADIMGNVIALTDASGSVAATFRYTPFGQLSARTGSVLPRYLFSSKEFDRPANLYYYGYRYYAPRLGRWMTRDPLGEVDTPNVFVFVRNVANNNIDAFG
ncbi:MAG: RHS repeat protein, partial [Kiritimatiellae bacterium]|nr:RHS repeat protein [Kiritimatiellia bacterium]